MKLIMKYFKLILAINLIFLFEGYGQIQDSIKQKDSFLQKKGLPLTFNPIFIKCVSQALKDFPMMNISYQNNKIIKKKHINLGIAVALEDYNLIVPVLKNCDKLSLRFPLESSINAD